jgi:hypothetical protein
LGLVAVGAVEGVGDVQAQALLGSVGLVASQGVKQAELGDCVGADLLLKPIRRWVAMSRNRGPTVSSLSSSAMVAAAAWRMLSRKVPVPMAGSTTTTSGAANPWRTRSLDRRSWSVARTMYWLIWFGV